VDAAFSLAGLVEELGALLDAEDFEGAEELLTRALTASGGSKYDPFLHFQIGRVYIKWNKLSSALQHLGLAAEMAKLRDDEVLLFQVLEEFKSAKGLQLGQRP